MGLAPPTSLLCSGWDVPSPGGQAFHWKIQWEAFRASHSCLKTGNSPIHPPWQMHEVVVPMQGHSCCEEPPRPGSAVPVDDAVDREGEAIKGVCYHQEKVVSHREELPIQGTGDGRSRGAGEMTPVWSAEGRAVCPWGRAHPSPIPDTLSTHRNPTLPRLFLKEIHLHSQI